MHSSTASETGAPTTFGDELPGGTVLCHGQYEIREYLNSGGFGVTYLALDSLGRKVVIKECYPADMCWRANGSVRLRSQSHEMDFDRVVELFEREARALAQLSHPNIVGVHQIFKDNGTAYMAMDFVEGPDLFDLLETQPERFEPAEISRILRQLLNALTYVHDHGMLHRDISPDNILLGPGGTPILIDFGAAREDAARSTRILSRIHSVKDGYSPQEFYLVGSPQEKSSDLYSLAATIYHLITGRPPPNSNVRLAAVAQNMPDPYIALAGKFPGYEDGFLASIDTCLSLFSKDRLATAGDWLDCISGPARKAPGAAPAVLSETLQQAISELVAETSSFLADPNPEPAPPRRAPDPLETKRAAEQSYWSTVNQELEQLRIEVERERALERAQAEQAALEAQTVVEEPVEVAQGGWSLPKWLRSLFEPRTAPPFGGLKGLEK